MANNISWGKIYDTSYWGVGVATNTISWGKVYGDLANSASFSLDFDKIATDFTFTRSSFATRVNEFGLIETSPADTPRIDYTTGEAAFLLEPQSTNEIAYSNDYTDLYWEKASSGSGSAPIVTSNYAISPDGTQNADRIQFNATASGLGTDRSRIRTTLSLSDVTDYTFSFYAKSTDGTDQQIGILFDNSQISVKTVTSEWQRFEGTQQQSGTTSVCGLDLRSDTVSESDILVYGIQIEPLPYATSYIPTSGAITTRSEESCNKHNLTTNGLFGDKEGVVFLNTVGVQSASTSLNSFPPFRLYRYTGDNYRFYYDTDAAFVGTAINLSANGGELKIAFSVSSTEINLYVNGSLHATHTIINPMALDLEVWSWAPETKYMERVKDFRLYNRVLTDDQLVKLTTI